MPMNSVVLHIKLTSHKPQQTCNHCNTVPTGKYLTFYKTKYGENPIVSQMTEKDQQNIICNKCHNAICRETLVTCLRCTKTMTKICTLKFDSNRYISLEQNIQEMAKSHKTNCYICKSCHEELQQKRHVCVVTDRCRNMYAKCIPNKTMTSHILLYHNACNIYQILHMKCNIYVYLVTKH